MKKIVLVSIITIVAGLIFYFFSNLFDFLMGFQILLIPLVSGVFLVLVQEEDRSYNFLPKLITASLLMAFIFSGLIQFLECFNYIYGPNCSTPNLSTIAPFSLFLTGVTIFGGLIGIVIKGSIILLHNKNKL